MSTCTNLHTAVDALADEYRNRLHILVQAAESQLARDMHWETTAKRQRDTITTLEKQIACLTDDLGFALSAMLAYRELCGSLTTVQAGAERLLSALRDLEARQPGAGRCAGEIARLTLENEGMRRDLEQCGADRRAEWQRAENAEAEVGRLNAALAERVDTIRELEAGVARSGVHWMTEIACLRQNLADATETIRPYAATLTAIRKELGALNDADLVEEVGRLRSAYFNATEQGGALMREYCRLERVIKQQRTGIALARAYKGAVEKIDGVADAEAALFAWLEEWE